MSPSLLQELQQAGLNVVLVGVAGLSANKPKHQLQQRQRAR